MSSGKKTLNYIYSQKGKLQLFDNGYTYVQEKVLNDRTYWRCSKYTTKLKCYGRVHTADNYVVQKTGHSHGPEHKIKKENSNFMVKTENNSF